ncbi:MAG: Ig-like domain-containing protein [Solirubrobacteraceae bacterium]
MIRHRVLPIAVLAALLLGALASSASAGTYQVLACDAAPHGENHSWAWSSTDASQPDHYAQYDNCPYTHGGSGGTADQQGGLSTADALALSNGAAPGTSAGWSFTAPPGTSISAISYERYLGHTEDPSNSWVPALRVDGAVVAGQSCLDTSQNQESCHVGAPPGEGVEPGTVTGLDAQTLSVSIACQALEGEECVTGATEHKVWAALYGATVTLSDTTSPTLGTPTGSLWETGTANGYHKGSESLTVEAGDIGGGVRSIILSADGTPVDTYQAPCNYTYTQPCPASTGPQTLTLPTEELADGQHNLTLVAIDAAGNDSTIASKQIVVDNTAPSAPLELKATPTTEGSTTFTATWKDPPGHAAPITQATYQVCSTAYPSECQPAVTAPPEGPATVTVPGAGTWTLAVWLTDAAGNTNPTSAATISLVGSPSQSGSSAGGGESENAAAGTKSTGSSGSSGGPGIVTSGTGKSAGSSGGGIGNGAGQDGKLRLRINARRHGRIVEVHLRGPRGARVRLACTILRRGGTHRTTRRVVTLRRPRATASLPFGVPLTHYRIVVIAKLHNLTTKLTLNPSLRTAKWQVLTEKPDQHVTRRNRIDETLRLEAGAHL